MLSKPHRARPSHVLVSGGFGCLPLASPIVAIRCRRAVPSNSPGCTRESRYYAKVGSCTDVPGLMRTIRVAFARSLFITYESTGHMTGGKLTSVVFVARSLHCHNHRVSC